MKSAALIAVLLAGTLSIMLAAPPAGSEKKEAPTRTGETVSFAKDLKLAAWRSTGQDVIIILFNLKTCEYTRLKNHDPAPNGMKVKAAHLSFTRKDVYVELELNGETGEVRYDNTFFRQAPSRPPNLPDSAMSRRRGPSLRQAETARTPGSRNSIAHAGARAAPRRSMSIFTPAFMRPNT